MNNILEVTALNKTFKNFSLRDVSFTLPEDCVAGFIGVNGAGKTTTIRTMLGLSQRDSGIIKLFGKDMNENERDLKNRIGVVLDEGSFYDELTITEMKSIIAPAYSTWSEKDYNEYIDRFELNRRQKISALSKGMRMKFALSLALSHKADLLIMDEPTSGLDPLVRSQLLDIVREYMKPGGKGVFFSTHIISDLDKAADILIFIHEGKILFQKDKDELMDTHRLVKGSTKYLTEEIKNYFISINVTDFGFTGLTNKITEVQKIIPDIITEKPSTEDIMLGYIEEGKNR